MYFLTSFTVSGSIRLPMSKKATSREEPGPLHELLEIFDRCGNGAGLKDDFNKIFVFNLDSGLKCTTM